MKKSFAILLALALLGQLCACGQLSKLKNVELPPLPTVTERPAEEAPAPEAPEETAPAEEPAPMPDTAAQTPVIVGFRETRMEDYDPAEGEQKILTFSYVTPLVTIPGREEAAKAINEYIAMLDETFYTGNDYGDGPSDGYYGMLEQAEDNFTYAFETGTDLPLEFSCERFADVYRVDEAVLCLALSTSSYTGGAHGFYATRCYNFDTQSGEILTLEQITPDYEAFKAFLVRRMVEMTESDPDLQAAMEGFVPAEEREERFGALPRDGSWYLDAKGLSVFSDLYELASYAAGVQTFSFSYEELGDLLDARWRPAETIGAGSLKLLPLTDQADPLTVLDTLTLSEEGTSLYLYGDGAVYDLRLNRAGQSEYLEGYYRGEPLWYASCLQDAALLLKTELPDGAPELALSYRGADGAQHGFLLTQSGEDGRLSLQETDFAA